MHRHFIRLPAILLLALPLLQDTAVARPTEIRISVEYRLSTDPAEAAITITESESVGGAAERKEVEVVSSGGLFGAMEALATAIDTSTYTKVDRIERNGKTYDVFERIGATGGTLNGTATINVATKPALAGIQLRAVSGPIDISTSGDVSGPDAAAKRQALIAQLERRRAEVIDQLNASIAFSEDEKDRLFSTEPQLVTKHVPYRVGNEERTLRVTIEAEMRRVIDAPLGENP